MSHSSPDPGGKSDRRLVSYVRISADRTYTFQCAYQSCTIGCVGDSHCRGVKIPLVGPDLAIPPPMDIPISASSSSSSSLPLPCSSNSGAPVVSSAPSAPIPEINTLLMQTSNPAPLDPSSPTTKQYMKGILHYFYYKVYYLIESEVTEFAEWHAINENQSRRDRNSSRQRKIQRYKGIFYIIVCFISIY